MILVDQPGDNLHLNPKRNNRRATELTYDEIDPADSSDNDVYNEADLSIHDDDMSSERDFFSLPSLGLNYLNNLNLNLNLNINLKNTSLWKIYENGFNRPGFNPKNDNGGSLDLDVISQQVDTKTWFEWLEFKPEHFLSAQTLEALRITNPKNVETVKFDDSLSATNQTKENETSQDFVDLQADLDTEEFWSSFTSAGTGSGTTESGQVDGTGGGQSSVAAAQPPLNPYYHRLHLSLYDKIKIGICSVTIAPIRVVGIFLTLCVAWFLAFLGMSTITFEEVQSKPLSSWRRVLRSFIARCVMRTLFFFCGFHWVKIKGERASRRDAPVLAVASHSSLFDAFPLILMGAPSVVAKSSVRNVMFFGKLVDMTQPVYVTRESANSRQSSVKEIINRARSSEDWPQIFIFPEGTCTNRSCFITFKAGAFVPGVPVQPVLVKYPNRCDTVTWTFDGISAIKSFWLTLCQFTNYLELEFLPVVVPTEEEKSNAVVYAARVQQIMAKASGIPAIQFSLEDGYTLEKMRASPLRQRLEKVWNLRQELKLTGTSYEVSELKNKMKGPSENWQLSIDQFAATLDLPKDNPTLVQLFSLFDQNNSGIMNLKEYIFYACLLHPHVLIERVVPVIFMMYGNATKYMTKESFKECMMSLFYVTDEDAETIFKKGAKASDKEISLDEFKQALRIRLEFAKLFAMEANGELDGDYPPKNASLSSSSTTTTTTTTSTDTDKDRSEKSKLE